MATQCCCEIQAGTFGIPIIITLKDCDGVVIDISASTTRKIRLESPDGTGAEYTATYPTGETGVEGRVQYMLEDGDIPDTAASVGVWKAQAVIDGVPSGVVRFEVEGNIEVGS